MARELVDDALWEIIEPLLPPPPPRKTPAGRKRLDERRVLTGILFILQAGLPWEMLPKEMGCGSGMSCWRRAWGKKTGPNPTDRRKAGSKHHLLVDGNGIPLNIILTGANRHDSTQLMPLLKGMPPIAGRRGHPLKRSEIVQADRGYDCERYRSILRQRGMCPQIGKRCTRHGSHPGITRWVVERTIAWLHQFRRLRVRYERRADLHEGFLRLGCVMICWKTLRKALRDPFPFSFC